MVFGAACRLEKALIFLKSFDRYLIKNPTEPYKSRGN
jgi:hypothetical protein